jgi:benzoyl-CoA reductase/2-hydroxyglutaryl-CoA dehydratase subunit BcrC/BadD/HgdB
VLDVPSLPPVPERAEILREHQRAGGRIAAVFPIHYPRALLRAFGYLPIEVWGPPRRDTGSGARHLQPYTCSVVRSGLSFLLDGGLDQVDAICVPHACDSLQGLGSVLLDFVRPRQPVLTFYLPRARRAADRQFIADELRALFERLAEIGGTRPSSEALMQAVLREERADRLLGELFARRRRLPLGNRELYRVARSREYLPAERFSQLAEAVLGATDGERPGKPIMLSGIVPEPLAMLDVLDEAGALIVADDTACAGRRVYPEGRSDDPFERLAESLDSGPPDPTRGHSIEERVRHLSEMAERSGARGVLFYDVKFCEPEQFYLPLTRQGLSERGVRSLAVEVDIADSLPSQLVTRLEAFVETLS